MGWDHFMAETRLDLSNILFQPGWNTAGTIVPAQLGLRTAGSWLGPPSQPCWMLAGTAVAASPVPTLDMDWDWAGIQLDSNMGS